MSSVITPRPFAHLHCHSQFSMLDGANRLPDLVAKVKAEGMNSVAITDHGNLCGAFEFYNLCKDAGIKPIVGYEAYIAPGNRRDRGATKMKEASFHLTLLAMNRTGYFNLVKLASMAFLEGFYYRPRIDKEILKAHSEGLICLSGCAASELSQYLLGDRMDDAKKLIEWYIATFGDRFYMEIQNAGLDIQKQCMDPTVDLARQYGLPLVATNDAHYLNKEDAAAHDVLLCVSTRSTVNDEKRMRMECDQFYVRTPEEMYAAFPGFEEAVKQSQLIADRVDIELEKSPKHYPKFSAPDNLTDTAYLRKLCEERLTWRYGENITDAIRARLDLELATIDKMGYSSYFLIVWDFVRFAEENDIPCGARGSACGAMVAYLLGLSHVCPLEYDLLFERFLDASRTEPPDIDIDFCRDGRQKVIDYTKAKYGIDNVCQIGTFGTLKAKLAIRDVGRALGIPLARVDQIAKSVPEELNIKLKDAIEQSPDLKEAYGSDPEIKKLLDIAQKLEGLTRNVGTHAAGVVVSDAPIDNYIPLQTISGKEDVITQWDGPHVEKAGLLKMDFLGLRNLTILHKSVQNVRKHRGVEINTIKLPLDDEQTFALLQRGETKGVFQFESGGIRDLLTKMKPDKFADIIATSALYRPGPLEGGMVMDYVDVKHGRKAPTLVHPIVDEILAETYGVMCIHEDVRVSMADGSEKPIREMRRGDWVHSLNYDTSRFDIKECHGCGPTRRGEGLRITLENGFCVTLTPDHKVYTFDGWKEAQELQLDRDIVATAMYLPTDSISRNALASGSDDGSDSQDSGIDSRLEPDASAFRLMGHVDHDAASQLAPWLGNDDDVAYLLGYLVGDGCLTGKGINAATGTRENHDRLVAWLRRKLPALHVNEYFHERSWYIGLSCDQLANDLRYGNRKTKLHQLLDELGLKTKARQKHVPRVLFQSAASVRRAFLAGLLDSDGCFAENSKGAGICFFSSVSNTLLEDVRRLSQLDGIPVMMRRNRIHLWNLERLHEVVGDKLVIKQVVGRRTAGATVGWVRRERVLQAIGAGESQRSFCERTGINRRSLSHKFPFVKSSTAAKAGIDLGDVRYFRIAAIEKVTDQQFYGMSVADHHNLVGNGVVIKNCYQEQVMRILNRVGGIELADAYKCIKAISKKKEKIIASYYEGYVKGAVERGLTSELAINLFELIKKFAGYGFNKSHSTAYGAVSYQTAYLKAHYPAEFMAALLTCGMEDSDRIAEHTDDARRMGISIVPPDINTSDTEFMVVDDKRVSFGMAAIKGLGESAVQAIVAERTANGKFKDIFDLAERVDPKVMQKATLEILIKAGALDSLGPNRAQHMAAVERAVAGAAARQKDKQRGQKSLFGGDDEPATNDGTAGASPSQAGGNLPEAADWTHSQKLSAEKEVLGFFLTSHPLTQVADKLSKHTTHDNKQLGDLEDGTEVLVAGMIGSIKKAQTKKPSRNGHSKYVNFDLEDPTGIVRCIMWPEDYARLGDKVQPEAVVFLKGKVDRRSREPNLIVNQLFTVEEADKNFTTQIAINFKRGLHGEREMTRAKQILENHPGKTDVILIVDTPDQNDPSQHFRFVLSTPSNFKVSCNADLQSSLNDLLGREHIQLIAPPKETRMRSMGSASIGR